MYRQRHSGSKRLYSKKQGHPSVGEDTDLSIFGDAMHTSVLSAVFIAAAPTAPSGNELTIKEEGNRLGQEALKALVLVPWPSEEDE